MRTWTQTDECGRRAGSGFYVRIGAELGYAKLDRIQREKIGSVLGRRVGVPVAFVEYAKVDGDPNGMIFAVSHVKACTDQEVGEVKETGSVKNALSRASGLLAFLRWIFADTRYGATCLRLRAVAVDGGFIKVSDGLTKLGPTLATRLLPHEPLLQGAACS